MTQLPFELLVGWDIVVIDDEIDSLDVANIILDFYGANVRTAENGRMGLNLIQTHKPTLLITDLSMPEMDGWSLLRQLRDDPNMQNIPVIALSAHAMVGDRERALAAGFDGYITKPISADTFMEIFVEILKNIPILNGRLSIETEVKQ